MDTDEIICPICGTRYYHNEKYCLKCGERLGMETSVEKVCPNCRSSFYHSEKYCMKCGEKLTTEKLERRPGDSWEDENREENRIRKQQCRIKNKQQFIEECERNGIQSEWYSFTNDPNKPVCIDGLSVYAEHFICNCKIFMQVWDVAFERLMLYKREYEWEHTGEIFNIYSIEVEFKDILKSHQPDDLQYPNVCLWKSTSTYEPDPAMIEKGWQPDSYSYYDGYYSYHKYVDIRTVLDYIVIKFKKKTDDRDRAKFGITEPITRGAFKYPIPEDLREEIARNVFDNIANEEKLSGTVREKIIQMVSPDILEKEFKRTSGAKRSRKKKSGMH